MSQHPAHCDGLSISLTTADLVVAASVIGRIEDVPLRGVCAVVEAICHRGVPVNELTVGELVRLSNEVLA